MAPFSIILVGEFCVTIYTRRGDVQQLPQFSDVRFDVCHFRIVLCREDRSVECRNVAAG